MTTVFVKGLGLIGSSLIRAIRLSAPKTVIIGCDSDKKACDYAVQHHLIDRIGTDLTAAETADFIILAAPVTTIVQDLQELAHLPLKKNVIVTDVGSTKQIVLQAAAALTQQGITFIGGHPMAGSHKSGVTAGRADLFENAFYFLIPAVPNEHACASIQTLLRATHVKWLTLTAAEHDKIVGQISHLPHIIAAALVNQTQQAFADFPLGMRLAAGGFKSITRIASSDPLMWSAILNSNAAIIMQQLEQYIAHLEALKTEIAQSQQHEIYAFFQNAKTSRDQLGADKVGELPGFYDLFINIPDQVGTLAAVTQLLAQNNINIVNIHILEIREDIDGVLQLTFMRARDRSLAEDLLQQKGYLVLRKEH
ncbi:prephenate dehydrogenase [Liquorilactobacillus satsumensis]|uniref:prephenate dehydrogenase n=1 Tax=Liquorilactobacillus satsumensis TaxID=259059 RepID=UPI0021C2948F|nr:prephenate dehydrogenase [Liquorilactobacillus satsumensis]MCP9312272.1 prephenate dehydrogenase [Liquorilactobacillus satsumensis]MCP9359551.1 prephenate dehydrogenase [Liquorilactobacillus satsumensis]